MGLTTLHLPASPTPLRGACGRWHSQWRWVYNRLGLPLSGVLLVGCLVIPPSANAVWRLHSGPRALLQQVQWSDAPEPVTTRPQPVSAQDPHGLLDVQDPHTRERLLRLATDNPRALLQLAQAWQPDRGVFPEDSLKKAVETAWRPDASWPDAEAAIRAFALFKNCAWVQDVLTPFVTTYAADILFNLDWFMNLHQEWTRAAMAVVVQHLPDMVLADLGKFVAIDLLWAKALAETAAAVDPVSMLSHADVLMAVDPPWAQGLIQQAAPLHPRDVVRHVGKFATPWGQRLFEAAVLHDPSWAVGMASARLDPDQAILKALQRSTAPPVQGLARIAESPYPEPIKGRMVVFMWQLGEGHLTFAEAARISNDEQAFFHTLVAMRLANRPGEEPWLDPVLEDEALELTERINDQHAEPADRRFRVVTPFTAEELYLLIAYGEPVMYTSSYRGLFTRLLTKMRQAKLTGNQLLASVHDLRFRAFIKAAAVFNRLDAFLATIPSPVDRWSLLARCLRDIDRSADIAVQALTAAGMISTLHEAHSLRLIRDIIKNEYSRAEQEHNREALTVYGLLAANLGRKLEKDLYDQELETIAYHYASHIPDLKVLPLSKLFKDGVSIQRYFFYDDKDGEESFNSFISQYRHTQAWHIEDKDSFVHIFSKSNDRRIDIYANKPASEQSLPEMDQEMHQRGLKPQVIVHRGHSYHVRETIDTIPATAAIVFLGNCGSYSQLDAVLAKAPEAHIISTQGIGSLTVNDPLLKALNERLLRDHDLRWADFWQQAAARLAHNPRFADYLPPDQNTGAIFLKAYRRLTMPQGLTAAPDVTSHGVAQQFNVAQDQASASPHVTSVRVCHTVPQ